MNPIITKEQLYTFIKINHMINADYTDPKDLLRKILRSALIMVNVESASILLLNQKKRKLFFEVAEGVKSDLLIKYHLEPGQGIAGWAINNKQTVVVEDVHSDARFHGKISEEIQYDTRNLLAVPMFIHERCIGVIEVLNKKETASFNDIDIFWMDTLANQAALAIINARYFCRIHDEVAQLKQKIKRETGFHPFCSTSKAMQTLLTVVERIAKTDSTVLLLGESGVGKELFAEQIHLYSPRKENPFVRINCAAIPDQLLESELFGYVEGAFTDAKTTRKGKFLAADKGTILLDEIGDVSPSMQIKLLRVLQEKTFDPLGSETAITVDVRIIASTNKNLEELTEQGSFREDLYYRLNVLPLYIPPLRERLEDIQELAYMFLQQYRMELKKYYITGFTDRCVHAMKEYKWPGNVRELQNHVQRGVIMCERSEIDIEDMFFTDFPFLQKNKKDVTYDLGFKDAVHAYKASFLKHHLSLEGWNKTSTAKKLDMQRTYLSKLIRELNIKKD